MEKVQKNINWTFAIIGILEAIFGCFGLVVALGTLIIARTIINSLHIFTVGWAIGIAFISILAIVGGAFTARSKNLVLGIVGSLAASAPFLPFAMLILPRLEVGLESAIDGILAFGWLISPVLLLVVLLRRKQFGK